MDIKTAFSLLSEEMAKHELTSLSWKPKLDDAERRFGKCDMKRKVISLSRPLVQLNSEEEVRDTILHEIAHALAWERHQENCAHDQRWKDICIEIGARPERCYDEEVVQPDARWVLCHKETNEVFASYQRKPSVDFSDRWIRGRKNETHTKLILRPNASHTDSGHIAQFDRPTAMALREEILTAVQTIAEARGINITDKKAAYEKFEFTLNLQCNIPLPDGVDPEREEFELLAGMYHLSADDFHRPFRLNGKTYLLTGFKPRNTKYPIVGIDATGKSYKFREDVLDDLEDRNLQSDIETDN